MSPERVEYVLILYENESLKKFFLLTGQDRSFQTVFLRPFRKTGPSNGPTLYLWSLCLEFLMSSIFERIPGRVLFQTALGVSSVNPPTNLNSPPDKNLLYDFLALSLIFSLDIII
ncbi:hypothetical protein BpHYR1_044880 [Brachionus plicatilis]|uniref:Uncharacterized protein n=1 Tax=Brachionus plicatilis TaxID=10195 RepID=A0A3M7R257_BRAPC|nr:hypothetical protein BpHYR1_044880 [Brachionus plicatilis]